MVQPSMDLYVNCLVLLAATLLALVPSLAIVFQAYRGYRRNRSQPMLWLMVGLVLPTAVLFVISLTVVSAGTALGFDPVVHTYYVPTLNRLIEVIGPVCILYSLYSRPRITAIVSSSAR